MEYRGCKQDELDALIEECAYGTDEARDVERFSFDGTYALGMPRWWSRGFLPHQYRRDV
jgi:hypothetical protein